ncbi:MAG TPA: nucleotidyl transferase AbiEii/AbiGii toxin family protein [Nordella sp.]|nr:nucleotidyl transferase AbiEii/AbiGii toxin family protein [Nordella sp.]
MEAWRSLIRRAVARLEALGLGRDEWQWGGGTVLMLRYRHRFSRDVDLFIDDVQYLSYLSPRLSDRATDDILGYSEQANHLRLEYPEGEIDFLTVAPVFPDLKPIGEPIEGVDGAVRLMADKEIIGQKLFYRAATFTGRDLYDFVAVTKGRPELLNDEALRKVALARRDALVAALSSPNCERGYKEIDRPSLSVSFATARDALLDWLSAVPSHRDAEQGRPSIRTK